MAHKSHVHFFKCDKALWIKKRDLLFKHRKNTPRNIMQILFFIKPEYYTNSNFSKTRILLSDR